MPRKLEFRKKSGRVFQKSVFVIPRRTEISEKWMSFPGFANISPIHVLVKCFPDQEETCYRFHQDGMAENFYENHIYKLACNETSNVECQQFIGRAYT